MTALPLDTMERVDDHVARLLAGTFHADTRGERDAEHPAGQCLTVAEWRARKAAA